MIYFDNAATVRYKPQCVLDAVMREYIRSANPGRSGHNDSIDAALIVHRARESVKKLINNMDAEVCFTKNCTEALNLAILGTVRQGGHVITSVMEHNSILRPLNELKRDGRIKLTILDAPNGTVEPSKLVEKICSDTYLIALTHMSNVTGAINKIEEIGKITSGRGIILLVDAAQSLGHIPFDMRELGCDIVAAPAQKGLHGVQGAGFLCYSKRIKINPIMYGGTGTESENIFQPRTAPESLESGTQNTAGIAALGAGIEWTAKNFDKINTHIQNLSKRIIDGLKYYERVKLYTENLNGIISFEIKGLSSSEVADILNDRYDIAVRSGIHCAPYLHKSLNTLEKGLVRVSVGYNNNLRDVKRLLYAINEILKI